MSVLAIQPGAIGDVILSLPALAALRQTLGAARMEIWAERSKLPLLAHSAYADSVRPIETSGIDSFPLPEHTLAAMRAFDLVVSWRGAKFTELRHAVEQAHPHAYFLLQFPPEGQAIHLSEFRRTQIRALFEQYRAGSGLPAVPVTAAVEGLASAVFANRPILESNPAIPLKAEDRQFADNYLRRVAPADRPLAVIHPGASGAGKLWEPVSFAKVARQLAEHQRCTVLVIRGPLDREPVEQTLAALDGLPVHCAEIENLRSLAGVLARAALFVGNDSGITHLAAAVQAPTLAIFLSTDPRVWAPRGLNVQVLVRPSVEQVSERAEQLLTRRN